MVESERSGKIKQKSTVQRLHARYGECQAGRRGESEDWRCRKRSRFCKKYKVTEGSVLRGHHFTDAKLTKRQIFVQLFLYDTHPHVTSANKTFCYIYIYICNFFFDQRSRHITINNTTSTIIIIILLNPYDISNRNNNINDIANTNNFQQQP